MSASKQTAFDYIDEKSGVITDVSDKIWDYAELSLREYKSGELYAKVLKEEGFIKDYKVVKNDAQGTIELTLKYGDKKERVITGLKRISKPGLRVYAKSDEIPKVLNGLGIAIISTSKGIMTDKEARRQNLGGEVLAYIW